MFGFYSRLSAFGGERTRSLNSGKPLANRNQVDCMDAGLSGAAGKYHMLSYHTVFKKFLVQVHER